MLKKINTVTIFQSTHPSWGATKELRDTIMYYFISIHAPIVGCDITLGAKKYAFLQFQSTHPSWGATWAVVAKCISLSDFNPRTHRGVRHKEALAKEVRLIFQSTHPSWGATIEDSKEFRRFLISIHAPIVGCDL